MNDKVLLQKLIRWRRAIHQWPEAGHAEFRTAALIEKNLRTMKIPFRRIAPTGIVATLKGAAGARCVALRADMDALPVTETSGASYRSKRPGWMHACGHDAHVAMLLGAAEILSQDRRFPGAIKFFFQPNEEGAGGALSLIEAGAMKNPRVNAVFGLHVNPRLAPKTVGIKPGPLMAAVDRFEVTLVGRGGHAAYPHEGRDPLPMAAELILALQTLVARRVDPTEAAVVTVGTIQGGTRYNILAESVTITGTVRTLAESTHRKMERWIKDLAQGIARAHGAQAKVEYQVQGSVLVNDAQMAALARQTARELFGATRVVDLPTATMGGEDFAEYLKAAPGCFIYIGTGSAAKDKLVPWHHPQFNLDESAMPTGSRLLAAVAQNFLRGEMA